MRKFDLSAAATYVTASATALIATAMLFGATHAAAFAISAPLVA